MQPQSPPSPNQQYDFIFNGQQQPKQSFLGGIKKLPKLALIFAVLGFVFILVILMLALRGGSSEPQPFLRASARAQEISRVSSLVRAQTKDPDTQALAATAQVVLTSSQGQINAYMQKNKLKVDSKALLAFQDKKTDTLLEQASRENRLEETYNNYLKSSLTTYKADLEKARLDTGENGRALIDEGLLSVKTILSAPQLANL